MQNKTFYKLGENIRGLRNHYGETQLDLAIAIGIGKTAISNYELGERIPKRDVLLKISKHYRITEDELLNRDFSNLKNISKLPINDKEHNKSVMDKALPLVCSDESLINKNFKEAYMLHQEIYSCIFEEKVFNYSLLDKCINFYDVAQKENIIEATANVLWFQFLFAFVFVFPIPDLFTENSCLKRTSATIKDVLEKGFLHSFDEDSYSELYSQGFEATKKEFFEENKAPIISNIYKLRQSIIYRDLGDYYLALCYKFDILSNSSSPELNSVVGDGMMYAFALTGNKFAKNFFTLIK